MYLNALSAVVWERKNKGMWDIDMEDYKSGEIAFSPKPQLPNEPCFKGGLKFGDPAQIQYIKEIRAKAEEDEYMLEQGMKRYRVRVYIEGEYCQDVYAVSEDDAIEQVKDDFDIDYADIDFQYDADEMNVDD